MSLRQIVATLPAPLAVVLGFVLFIILGMGLAMLVPPARDKRVECQAKCHPLPGTLVDDRTYPLSSRSPTYPQVCKCGSLP